MPLATTFGPRIHDLELRAVYERSGGTAARVELTPSAVGSVFHNDTATTETGGPRGGPRARLYRRGDARLLHPALLRPGREDAVR